MSNAVSIYDVVSDNLQRAFAKGREVSLLIEGYNNEAFSALEQADRAVINSEESLGLGGELVKSITQRLKAVETTRKELTAPLDEAKSYIMAAFSEANTNFAEAKMAIKLKCDAFLQEETKRRNEAAAEERRAAAEAARLIVEARLEGGDIEAAAEAQEEAAAVIAAVVPDKVKATGVFGASVGGTRVVTGEVSELSSLLSSIVTSPAVVALVNEVGIGNLVEFKKSGLNKLAKLAADRKVEIAGLTVNDRMEARAR